MGSRCRYLYSPIACKCTLNDPSSDNILDQLFTSPSENAAAFCIAWLMNRARVHREIGRDCMGKFLVSSERASLEVYADGLEELRYISSSQTIALNQCREFLEETPLKNPAAVAYLKPKRRGRINQVRKERSRKLVDSYLALSSRSTSSTRGRRSC